MQVSVEFIQRAQTLRQLEARFWKGEIEPVRYANERESALAAALKALAANFNVPLEGPLHIDSRGEFNLIVSRADGLNPHQHGTGAYGEEFVQVLNQYQPRTGDRPGRLCAENGWYHMNHLQVEKIVLDSYDAQHA